MIKTVQTCNFLLALFSTGKLSNELQMLEEDPSEYKAPHDGNLVYKLFSLNDLLLLVRCSVQKVKSLPQKNKKKKPSKVQILLLAFSFCFSNSYARLAPLGFSVLHSIWGFAQPTSTHSTVCVFSK